MSYSSTENFRKPLWDLAKCCERKNVCNISFPLKTFIWRSGNELFKNLCLMLQFYNINSRVSKFMQRLNLCGLWKSSPNLLKFLLDVAKWKRSSWQLERLRSERPQQLPWHPAKCGGHKSCESVDIFCRFVTWHHGGHKIKGSRNFKGVTLPR